ncbi:MAG: hypothetical protein K9N05_06190 [Candidatus Marinimicrobia bacterium]|nr:hypothetical protein [Candidatus Neomarinimicrobiota bacterium]
MNGCDRSDKREDLMNNKNFKKADIAGTQGTTRRTTVLSRGVNRCCPFLNKVRYYKTVSLKDEKLYNDLNSGNFDKKRKIHDEVDENAGTSMMYCL